MSDIETHTRYVRLCIPGCRKEQTDANIRRFLDPAADLNRRIEARNAAAEVDSRPQT